MKQSIDPDCGQHDCGHQHETERCTEPGEAGAEPSRIHSYERKADASLLNGSRKLRNSLYMFLLNRREENALSQAMVDNNARVIDSADGSDAPISPKRNRILLLGGVAGSGGAWSGVSADSLFGYAGA